MSSGQRVSTGFPPVARPDARILILGSMDADIRLDASEVNDFERFLSMHRDIEKICFNGRKAREMFRRFVPLEALQCLPRLALLPSTSPAYASMPFAEKLQRWRSTIAT